MTFSQGPGQPSVQSSQVAASKLMCVLNDTFCPWQLGGGDPATCASPTCKLGKLDATEQWPSPKRKEHLGMINLYCHSACFHAAIEYWAKVCINKLISHVVTLQDYVHPKHWNLLTDLAVTRSRHHAGSSSADAD